ncbi:MAG: hypothetical protein HGB10_00220 [Coriobacteriia bacterium]|nr:hypothetical protein [Coriobacteriia bacterium]
MFGRTAAALGRFRDSVTRIGPKMAVERAAARARTAARLVAANVAHLAVARARGSAAIHVIGDSHVQLLGGVRPFVVTHIGPATAYNLREPHSSTGSHGRLRRALRSVNRRTDVVILSFGEIDCRIHVYRAHMKSGGVSSMESIIETTVARYAEVVQALAVEGYRIVVHTVPGAARQDNYYGYDYYADAVTRAWIADRFNEQLRGMAARVGVELLDLYGVTSTDGVIREDMTTDGTHLDARSLPLYAAWVESVQSAPRPSPPG